MPIPASVSELIERFERNREAYRSGQYNETQVRREFIDPMFKALGWDMDNEQGYAEAYKDVVHEDAIKVGGATKAPDYSFRIGGTRKFFLEAKKPSVNIKEDTHPAYQLRRYAWSAKLPLSILSDFEELAVYDCRIKPDKADKAAAARTLYLTYRDYPQRWDELSAIFSRQAVLKGSFDRYAESNKAKKGTQEVDAAFLQEIERWRDLLARNIALRNPGLNQRDLNHAVQATIDRIIFLRICEDRGIEPPDRLRGLQNGGQVYERLGQLFHQADDRYNSGLFHFKPEKGRETPDEWTLSLQIDDRPLKDMLKNLYYPDSPYEFSVLPADILGQVYEQFLGKVIRLTPGHRAIVEDKPEVKKAGGVYYTPTYIVDYIVKQTVGKLLEDWKAGRLEAGKKQPSNLPTFQILDPACGSGSFLIGAYQYLLDWYLRWYTANEPEKWAKKKNPPIYQTGLGGRGESLGFATQPPNPQPQTHSWQLTTPERKRILLEHIFGVDIDAQAVETTKLSLLLKVLEGESEQSLASQLSFFQERALPDLSRNIKCGNSLIGPDFYDMPAQQMSLFSLDEEERYRINVFDWQAEFPEIMREGGFDVVIGNPPYIRIQALKEWAPLEVEFYKKRYTSAGKGNYDIYVVFVEKGLSLLNERGRLGFILPHKFFNAQYGEALRGLIAEGKHLSQVVHFGDQQVFAGATTYTCLLFLDKQGQDSFHFIKAHNLPAWRQGEPQSEGDVQANQATSDEWNFTVGSDSTLFARLTQMPKKLENVTDRIFQGLKTGADKVFIVDFVEAIDSQTAKVKSPQLNEVITIETALLHPLAKGGDSLRFIVRDVNRRIIFPYETLNSKTMLISQQKMQENYPMTWEYLKRNKQALDEREHGKFAGSNWYGYSRNQALDVISLPKIFTRDISNIASYSLDIEGKIFFTGGAAGGYGILPTKEIHQKYLIGLLNSRLLDWFLEKTSTQMRGGWRSYEARFIKQLPIRVIDFTNPADKANHDRMVALVEQMLALHQQLAAAKSAHDKTALQRQIAATDRQIDRLVYALYNLSEEEIRLVEGKGE